MADLVELKRILVSKLKLFTDPIFVNEKYEDLSKIYHPQVTIIPNGGCMVTGIEGVEATLRNHHAAGLANIVHIESLEPERLGEDSCMIISRWKGLNSSGEQTVTFKDVTVWKRDNGDWFMYIDMFNSP